MNGDQLNNRTYSFNKLLEKLVIKHFNQIF